jgi:hypothetical protein
MARRRDQSPARSDENTESQKVPHSGRNSTHANTLRRQMLALPSLLKKPKHEDKEVQQFSKKVTSDRKELKALLDQRMQQA